MRRECADCQRVFETDNELYEIRRPMFEIERLMREQNKRFRDINRFWLCISCWKSLVGAALLQSLR